MWELLTGSRDSSASIKLRGVPTKGRMWTIPPWTLSPERTLVSIGGRPNAWRTALENWIILSLICLPQGRRLDRCKPIKGGWLWVEIFATWLLERAWPKRRFCTAGNSGWLLVKTTTRSGLATTRAGSNRKTFPGYISRVLTESNARNNSRKQRQSH